MAADDSDLTMLNVHDPALPTTARDALRDVASTHPEYFPAAQKGGSFVLEKNVRLASDGVFVADNKVADLTQVVEHITREDVAEIRARLPYSPAHDAAVGFAGGALIVLGFSLALCQGICEEPAVFGGAALMGGITAGILVTAGAVTHHLQEPRDVIYRAP